MSEAGVCRGEAVDAIYGGAHRPRVQVLGTLQFKELHPAAAQLKLKSKKTLVILHFCFFYERR
jgi:hypothetical protein